MTCKSQVNSAMWPSFLHVEYFITVLFMCKFHKDHRLCSGQSRICFFFTQGQVTPNRIEQSCWNSNSSEMLRLCRLSATFIKIQSKLNRLCFGQGRIWVFLSLKGCLKSQWSDMAEFALVWDCMSDQVICKFRNVSIKTKQAMLRTM